MHTDIYGYVKGCINSRIMKGNGTRRKNVNPINRISGYVCFILFYFYFILYFLFFIFIFIFSRGAAPLTLAH